jgi:hypothetical protein
VTYGSLIGQAKRLLQESLTRPLVIPDAAEAVAICHARTRLYRVVSGGLTLHLNLRSGGRRRFPEFPGDGPTGPELELLNVLHRHLRIAARQLPDAPPTAPGRGTAARLVRAGDLAGAAFDLLAGHLDVWHGPPLPASQPLAGGGVRVTACDAAQLAQALTGLDRRLELPLYAAAATPGLDPPARRLLLATANNSRTVTRRQLGDYAAHVHRLLRTPPRRIVEMLDLADPVVPRLLAPAQPEQLTNLVAELGEIAHRNPRTLSIPDLAAIASVASRAGALTAFVTAPVGGPAGPALASAGRWRQLRHDLNVFAIPTHGHRLTTAANQFASWVDPIIHQGHRFRPATAASWLPAVAAITDKLADLAATVTRTIARAAQAGDLLLPFDPATRGREHLYQAAKPTDPRVARLRRTAAATHQAAGRLARDVAGHSAQATPNPARTGPTLSHPVAGARGRTPPPPGNIHPLPAVGRHL